MTRNDTLSVVTCGNCGKPIKLGDWPFCEEGHSSTLRQNAQRFDPVVVFRDSTGHLRFPGRSDVPTPKGYERLELRTTKQVRDFQKGMDAKERARYMESKEREHAYFDPFIHGQRSELREKMRHFSPAGKALAEAAIRENDRTTGPDMRFDAGFHIAAFEENCGRRK